MATVWGDTRAGAIPTRFGLDRAQAVAARLPCGLPHIEEGAESCIVNGDAQSEAYLHELPGRTTRTGERDLSVEGMYEYGSRAGVWRVLELFGARALPLTTFAVGQALELNPAIGHALRAAGHEVAGHGYRWLDYRNIPEDDERRPAWPDQRPPCACLRSGFSVLLENARALVFDLRERSTDVDDGQSGYPVSLDQQAT